MMLHPVIRFEQQDVEALTGQSIPQSDLLTRIVSQLNKPPYFLRLTGAAPTEEHLLTTTLARLIAMYPPVHPALTEEQRAKVSFTQIRINREKRLTDGNSTAYSRTNQPLELHTDSSFKPHPHEFIAFQMVRADNAGGETLMACVDDLVARLDRETIIQLAQPVYSFGRGKAPILCQRPSGWHIRYYRSQIEMSHEGRAPLPAEAVAAMDKLDGLLRDPALQHRFRIESGEIMCMQNTRALHGRTGFDGESDRLMYRIRANAGCLG